METGADRDRVVSFLEHAARPGCSYQPVAVWRSRNAINPGVETNVAGDVERVAILCEIFNVLADRHVACAGRMHGVIRKSRQQSGRGEAAGFPNHPVIFVKTEYTSQARCPLEAHRFMTFFK
jgi:hypothetical protein